MTRLSEKVNEDVQLATGCLMMGCLAALLVLGLAVVLLACIWFDVL
jgi:hypothetical protein